MRSAAETTLLLVLTACGNYPDEDVPYLEALPTAAQVT